MKHLRRMWRRFLGTFPRSRGEAELAEELELHLEMQTEDNLRLGMSPAEARRQAVLKLGGVESVKEQYRDQRGLPGLTAFAQDMRYALRTMRRSPGFSAAALLSLALGIGVTTAIVSIADVIFLRSLPYAHPERLATVSEDGAISAPMYEMFRREARSLEASALFTDWQFSLAGAGTPERIPAARVSAGLFELLGVQPRLGRTFTEGEDQQGNDHVVLLGDALWKRRFGADPHIIGRSLILNDTPYTVIGVMPPGFRFPEGPEHHWTVGPFPPAEMWRPMALAAWERTCGGCFNFQMLVRRRPGVGVEQTKNELAGILRRSSPAAYAKESPDVTVLSLQDAVVRKVRKPVALLLGGVLLALAIACANVASLLLARGLSRREEIAIRLSIGAGRERIARQLFTESLALACLAGLLAVPIAWAAMRALVALAPAGIPRIDTIGLDARMLGFAFAAAVVSAVLFSIAPAAIMARQEPAAVLKTGTRTASRAPSRLRAFLVIGECALSIVLLAGAGLLAKSFLIVSRIPLGFHPENVLTMRTTLPRTRYDDQRRSDLIARLVSNCGTLPGVASAAAVSTLPLTSEADGWGLIAEDSPNPNGWVMLRVRAVTPGYFQTLGIRLIGGRDFTPGDRGGNPVAIVSASAAKLLWPGRRDPLGRRIQHKPPFTVIGIVEDTRASGIDTELRPYLYLPFPEFSPDEFALVVRSLKSPASLAEAVKAEIWKIDKDQPVTHVAVMHRLVADWLAPRYFPAVLMTVFGVFALALAALGIYGVLAYSVAQRTHEIGIRMALGASRGAVVAGIVRHACVLAVSGAALGVLAAYRCVPLLRSLLFDVNAADESIFLASAGVLVAVAVAASIVPAYRAARLDPMTSLRHE